MNVLAEWHVEGPTMFARACSGKQLYPPVLHKQPGIIICHFLETPLTERRRKYTGYSAFHILSPEIHNTCKYFESSEKFGNRNVYHISQTYLASPFSTNNPFYHARGNASNCAISQTSIETCYFLGVCQLSELLFLICENKISTNLTRLL